MSLIKRWREAARKLKTELQVLYLAYRDPRTPWYARAFALGLLAYAFSPLDLIPDFIPVLGHLDDLILLPLGILIARRLIPAQILDEQRHKLRETPQALSKAATLAAALIIALWLLLALLGITWLAAR